MNKGTLYVFTGPSGAGKGTLLSRLMAEDDRLFYSISATTRAPRSGETDGVQYYFLTRADFERKIAQNAFLEHARYVDNYYGTLEAPVNEKLAEGYDVILEIEVQGAMQVHQKRPDAVMVFIAPPSFEELAARLRGRGTEDEEKVRKRLETAKEELKAGTGSIMSSSMTRSTARCASCRAFWRRGVHNAQIMSINNTKGNIRRMDYNAETFDAGIDETCGQPLSAGQPRGAARSRYR